MRLTFILRFRDEIPCKADQARLPISLDLWCQLLLNILSEVVDGSIPAELFDLLAVLNLTQACPDGNLLVDTNQRSHLFLCEEKDLQHQVVSFRGASAKAPLSHKNEARKENALDCHNGPEKRKGHRIEVPDPPHLQCVYEDPRREQNHMNSHKTEVADDRGCKVSHALREGSSLKELLLVLGDCLDVFLHMTRNLHSFPSGGVLNTTGLMTPARTESPDTTELLRRRLSARGVGTFAPAFTPDCLRRYIKVV